MDEERQQGILATLRIIFPYLVFISVFILAAVGMAIWGAAQT